MYFFQKFLNIKIRQLAAIEESKAEEITSIFAARVIKQDFDVNHFIYDIKMSRTIAYKHLSATLDCELHILIERA